MSLAKTGHSIGGMTFLTGSGGGGAAAGRASRSLTEVSAPMTHLYAHLEHYELRGANRRPNPLGSLGVSRRRPCQARRPRRWDSGSSVPATALPHSTALPNRPPRSPMAPPRLDRPVNTRVISDY